VVAILEKRLGVQMNGCDIYVNAAGGIDLDEPGSDLGILAAIFSSMRNRSLPPYTVLLGELSLSGEIRPVSQVHQRVREVQAMGFRTCILPAGNLPLVDSVENVEMIPVKAVDQLSEAVFS
jgi:DNA repair protein RadA/Sms